MDFGYFECKNPHHKHSTEFTESKERAGSYTTRIFGNAARGEVYGYDTGNETEGLCVVVNPTAHDVVYSLTFPRWQSGAEITPVILNGEMVEPTWQAVGTSAPVRVSAPSP